VRHIDRCEVESAFVCYELYPHNTFSLFLITFFMEILELMYSEANNPVPLEGREAFGLPNHLYFVISVSRRGFPHDSAIASGSSSVSL
jgi:hypothetical protein